MSPQDKATTERHARTLRELVKRPENRVCADCKHNGISIFSIFFYLFLYSYHRALRSPLGLLEYVRSRLFYFLTLHICTSGVFLCIRCSGIHRGMGTHISKVKSIDLDAWTPEQMDVCRFSSSHTVQSHEHGRQNIQKWGNRLANLYWEAHLKPGHVPPDQ